MNIYIDILYNFFMSSSKWIIGQILFEGEWYKNFFWGIILISLFIWVIEIVFPWRKNQKIFRKDFWLDGFYLVFNFFIFSTIISGFYELIDQGLSSLGFDLNSLMLINIKSVHVVFQLLIFFVLLDFFQWITHYMLHKVSFLWNFHKVHHSVKEMSFSSHMRYHWMENVLYKPLKTLGVMFLGGFEPEQAYIVHFISITIGHFNHSNIKISWGPLKYIFNSPVMHLYHHAKDIPEDRVGVNFAISLSVWDYLFRTNYVPEDSGNVVLGFKGDSSFPKNFLSQSYYGFFKTKK
jgi:sterol desaturase/sphingolipid hydroxylase (fatty acid hydroxylase superfamily)